MSIIRPIKRCDKAELLRIMRTFYASDAVFTNGSDEIFENDIEACISENPYLEGFVIEDGGVIQGYAMIAKSFSTEFGKKCIWIEDLYIKEEFRSMGLGKALLTYITDTYKDSIFRLEVEDYNERAKGLYKSLGFTTLPNLEMKKD